MFNYMLFFMDYLHGDEFATLLVNAPWIPHEHVFDLVQV
jgi:hypothetical protein